jgi:hypothetical protein
LISAPSPVTALMSPGTLVGTCSNEAASAWEPGIDAATADAREERMKSLRSIGNIPVSIDYFYVCSDLQVGFLPVIITKRAS